MIFAHDRSFHQSGAKKSSPVLEILLETNIYDVRHPILGCNKNLVKDPKSLRSEIPQMGSGKAKVFGIRVEVTARIAGTYSTFRDDFREGS
jgi:hypothetical protein